uniref:Uncharacterized protein n=1 Tax=Rhipicephalus appendiculatus TaxID=34631 RepID=A0A131YG88_RHIAP
MNVFRADILFFLGLLLFTFEHTSVLALKGRRLSPVTEAVYVYPPPNMPGAWFRAPGRGPSLLSRIFKTPTRPGAGRRPKIFGK